jgi:hypothetical protein
MNKLAIINAGSSSSEAPFDRSGWDFWGVNNIFQYIPNVRWTGWFELHKFSIIDEQFLRNDQPVFREMSIYNYLDKLQHLNIPVYMQSSCQIIPNARIYPFESIISMFGKYFTSSASWMLALAIYLGYPTIGVFGCDMVDEQHKDKRPSFEYLLGYAKGFGIEVIIPNACPLLKCDKLYGFES